MEKDWRGDLWCLCPGKGWQGVHCLGRKSPASPGRNRVQKVTIELQRSPPSSKGKG